jgi:hypothetical protein
MQKTLWTFSRGLSQPESPVILARHGVMYGIAAGEGTQNGAVWMLTP